MNNNFIEIKNLINESNNIGIFTHIMPDGDAIGSAFAFALILNQMNINAKVYLPTRLQDEYKYFNLDNLVSYEKPSNLDLAIATDCSSLDRMGEYSKSFIKSRKTIAIDHHKDFNKFAMFNYIEDSSSASELLYDIFISIGYEITKEVAELLYLGIIRDTGGFMYDCASSHTFFVISKILKCNIRFVEINRKFMLSTSYKRILLLKNVLNNLSVSCNGKVAISTLNQEELNMVEAKIEDTQGLINYILNISTVEVAVLISEASHCVNKVSIRSKENVDASSIAGEFGGGGHQKAAGCQMYGSIDKTVSLLQREIGKRIE